MKRKFLKYALPALLLAALMSGCSNRQAVSATMAPAEVVPQSDLPVVPRSPEPGLVAPPAGSGLVLDHQQTN